MNIAIIYNLSEGLRKGTEQDKLADVEVLDTAQAVRRALIRHGNEVSTVNVCKNGLADLKSFDAIFNLAESTLGSDATEDAIAQKLEALAIPFTGSNAEALRRCADKELTKQLLIGAGIPTPNFQVFRGQTEIRTEMAYPLIVKPVHEDGSIGITEDSIVCDRAGLERKVAEILRVYREPALVEEYIDGREINAAVLGNGIRASVLPLSEIVFTMSAGQPRIVSFNAKWRDDTDAYKNTNNSCPAALDAETTAAISELAARACRIMGCRDYARVDIRVKETQLYVLEVNPNPCINPVGAGFIVSAQAAGFSYDDVVNTVMQTALARMPVIPQEISVG